MSIWGILGIEPTGDNSVIKKAYAKKLKLHHPEDDPEGYQQLREAYDAALKESKHITAPISLEEQRENIDEEVLFEERAGASYSIPLDYEARYVQPNIPQHPIAAFLHKVNEVYSDFESRIDLASWEALLNEDIVWNVEHQPELQEGVLSYLEDHHHFPRQVWVMLDNVFQFRENKEDLTEQYPDYFVEYILRQVNGTTELRYTCFSKRNIDFDIEHYLDLREAAQDMLMDGEFEEAGPYLSEAYALFSEDPDLELMRGKYFWAVGETEKALESFTHVIALEPGEIDGYWNRAQLLYDQRRYEEALADCQHLLEKDPEHAGVLPLAGACCMELGFIEEARKKFKQSFEIEHQNMFMYANWCTSANKHLYDVSDLLTADAQRRARKNNFWFCVFMFLRLTWLYIFVYLGAQLFFDVHPVFTGLFFIILLWNAGKIYRVEHILST